MQFFSQENQKNINLKRSCLIGGIKDSFLNQSITLMGWVNVRRDLGTVVFIELRDRTGKIQVVCDLSKQKHKLVKNIRKEFVLAVTGKLVNREKETINTKKVNGNLELVCEDLHILSESKTLAFDYEDDSVGEALRLEYRYLDLRSSKLQNFLELRHKLTHITRNHLSEKDFLEIETPILYKSTPEGARDYLVPSRVHNGKFYALPQSPQTLKQLLMIGNFDKYFQIARCFRDEDLRADRQPEFSQIDIEMSFVDEKDIYNLSHKLLETIWKKIKNVNSIDFISMSYLDAMNRFGCDKPDLRIPWEIKDLSNNVKGSEFKVFSSILEKNGVVKALAVPLLGKSGRSFLDKLTDRVKALGGGGLIWIKSDSGKLSSPMAKFFTEDKLQNIFLQAGGTKDGLVLIVAEAFNKACAVLSDLRLHLAEKEKAIDTSVDKFVWIKDFPLFENSKQDGKLVSCHHPFTAPCIEDIPNLLSGKFDYKNILSRSYDVVCNGYELASGSVRIHQSEVQKAIFSNLGFSDKEITDRFGFFVEALNYGTPPHAGIAFGVERLVMILAGTSSIRDVVAFPKTAQATELMSDSPGVVANKQLQDLGIKI
ncbi:MAG: aspartate--tRNA ligase [Bdellovibrionales bacterium]|nr:aspartate--tRNA ligase [Bdellovibrionales bacterium]